MQAGGWAAGSGVTGESCASSPLQVRMLNDQLMLLERAFLDPRAFPEERYYR